MRIHLGCEMTYDFVQPTPVIALLPFIDGYTPKLVCLVVFVVAAVSDIIDGRIARSRNLITDLGFFTGCRAAKQFLFSGQQFAKVRQAATVGAFDNWRRRG